MIWWEDEDQDLLLSLQMSNIQKRVYYSLKLTTQAFLQFSLMFIWHFWVCSSFSQKYFQESNQFLLLTFLTPCFSILVSGECLLISYHGSPRGFQSFYSCILHSSEHRMATGQISWEEIFLPLTSLFSCWCRMYWHPAQFTERGGQPGWTVNRFTSIWQNI